jgi:LacI family transcriptional regulator
MLSALNFYRTSRDAAKIQPSVAFIMRSQAKLPAANFVPDEQLLKGARRAAERMGYQIVPFQLEDSAMEGARLSRIIRSRGIDGVIIAALDVTTRKLAMHWDYFSSLCIESQHLGLSLHRVANNQSGATRTAVRRLFELGYRTIGLAVGESEETSLGKPFTAGYLIEIYEHKGLRCIPPLLLNIEPDATTAARLRSWVSEYEIDGVLSNWSSVPSLLKKAGLAIPREIGVATLDHNPHRGAIAGIRQSHELVGERAVEALALLMKTNQRGLFRLPNTTLIDGVWEDGPDLPPKNKKAPRAKK